MTQAKKILRIFVTGVMSILFLLILIHPDAVGYLDGMILLENRRPAYWRYLRDNAVQIKSADEKETDVTIYPVSKYVLPKISSSDFQFFFRALSRDRTRTRNVIYFLDGTGIDLSSSVYGNIDTATWNITTPVGKLENKGNFLSLDGSFEKNEYGINGILPEDKPLTETEDVYLYLEKLVKDKASFAMVVMDDAANSWDPIMSEILAQAGLKAEFGFRESYAAFAENGKKVYEEADKQEVVINCRIAGKSLVLHSLGGIASLGSILYDNSEVSLHKRGLNIVVFQDGKVADSVNFDTWDKMYTCTR